MKQQPNILTESVLGAVKPRRLKSSTPIPRSAAALLVASLVAIGSSSGETLNWDANITGTAGGGSGEWSTGLINWFDGSTNVIWDNNEPDTAIFGGVSGSVFLSESITAAGITFATNNYALDLNGFDLTVTGSVGGSATMSTLTIQNTGTTVATFTTGGFGSNSGPRLTGNMNVVLNGSGGWNPALGNHDFTGTLSLLGSGLIRSDGVPLGSDTGLVRLGGSHTLQLGTASGQFRTFNRDIELLGTAATFTTGGLRTVTLAGNITGVGDLRLGATQGALVLAGNNTYEGSTYVVGAGLTLIAAHDNAFGQSTLVETRSGSGGSVTASTVGFLGGVSIGSTAKIVLGGGNPGSGLGALQNFGGDNTFAGNIELGSNTPRVFGVLENSSLTLTGEVSQARGLTKVGKGTLVLTGKSIYGTSNAALQGWTAVNDGIVRIDFSQAVAGHDSDILNFGLATNTGTFLSLGGGTLEIKGRPEAINSQRFRNSGTANLGFTINPGASSVRAVQNSASFLSANLGQVNSRQVGGTVDFTLPTSGEFTLPLGTLATGGPNEIISANGTPFMTVGGSDWAARDAVNSIVGGATLGFFYTPNDGANLFGNADMSGGVDTTLGVDTSIISLRFNDPGQRTITATGFTLTTGGILVTPGVGANATAITGGVLRGEMGNDSSRQDLVIIQNNPDGEFTISSTISNASNDAATALTKSGSGVLRLTGANTYTGVTTVNEGILRLEHASALGSGNVVLNGGVIGLTGASGNFTRALGTGADQVRFLGDGGFAAYGGDRTVNIGGAGATVSWNNSGSSVSHFVPTMYELILGAPDADGTLIFQNGINTLSNASSPIDRTVRVENGSATIDARLAGVVSGGGGLIKTGAGTLEMATVNTYAGPTLIRDGRMLVTGSLHADSPVAVSDGGELEIAAVGKVNGPLTINQGGLVTGASIPAIGTSLAAVTLNDGGTLSPGVGVGALSTGSLTLNGGTLALEITDAANADRINVTGSVTLNAPVELSIALSAALAPGSQFTLIDNNGTDAVNVSVPGALFTYNNVALNEGDLFSVSGGFGVQHFQISYSGDTGNDVTLMAIPEPTGLAMLLGGLCGLVGIRRMRKT